MINSPKPISNIEKIKRKAAIHPLLASAAIATIGSLIWRTAFKRKI